MNKGFFLLFFIFLSTIAYAQEEAKYNFGSAQSAKELSIAPGDMVTTKLYFYNIHGNRVTHISLSAENLPEGWSITFDPPLHSVTVNISGILTTVEENLNVVPPSDVFESKPETTPEGIEFLASPIGYIGAKPVTVTFSVPETEQLGTSHNITIVGVAEYLGQTGTASIAQSRGFDYTITVAAKEFTEEIIGEVEIPTEEAISPEEIQPTQAPLSGLTSFFVANPIATALTGVVVVLVSVIVYLLFFRIVK